MNMKKLVLFTAIVIIALTLMGGLALAGGWTTVDYTKSHDPDDTMDSTGNAGADGTAIWNPTGIGSPHGDFSSSSNKCRVCHAVHLANSDSWRLLPTDSPATECNVCHGDTGLTLARPYGPKMYVPKGEHTIGATAIPDSIIKLELDAPLSCNTCHSVHGAGTLNGTGGTFPWNSRILRENPNGDTERLATGRDGVVGTGDSTGTEVATNFCADCHNANPNWDTSDSSSPAVWRPNKSSHVQGPAADGTLQVNGTTTTVAGWETSQTATEGCRACHAASSAGNVWVDGTTTPTVSAFPHQTIGSKLLFDDYDGDIDGTSTDPNRVLEKMDVVCGKCHVEDGDIDTYTTGVGETY